MTRLWLHSMLAASFFALTLPVRATGSAAPDFREIYELIRTNATGISDAALNQAAVDGLLQVLGAKATLETASSATNPAAATASISATNVFEGPVGYLRIARVGEGLDKALSAAVVSLTSTNKLKGLVLDLRFADGSDYAAAAAAADLFTSKTQPLLNWGAGLVSSHEKKDAIQTPLAVLVNGETARAAEALAAMLRETGTGLILGGRTAGRAMVMREFPLKSGGVLKIANSPVTLADDSVLSTNGVQPDIEVTVSLQNELAYLTNPFAEPKDAAGKSGATNRVARHSRLNEAELVRAHQEGRDRDGDDVVPASTNRAAEPEIVLVEDPALARALDLLRALAVVRQNQN